MVSEVEVINESLKVITQSNDLQIALTIATFIVASVAIGTLYVSYTNTKKQLEQTKKSNENLEKQILVSNFSIITNYTGDRETRKNRRILYKYYSSPLMKKLLEDYPNHVGKELNILNESLKQIGAMYERVGFLLEENPKLKPKFIEYHGFTMGVMWKFFEKLNDLNIVKDKSKGYTYFERIGSDSYSKWEPKIKQFLEEKQNQNKNRKNSEIIKLEKSF